MVEDFLLPEPLPPVSYTHLAVSEDSHRNGERAISLKKVHIYGADDLLVIGTPVYAGRIPNKMLPFVQTHFEGNGALAIPVAVFGNRNFDNGLIELRNELEAHGFHTIAGAGIPTEHVFSDKLATGRPDADDLAQIHAFGIKAVSYTHLIDLACPI